MKDGIFSTYVAKTEISSPTSPLAFFLQFWPLVLSSPANVPLESLLFSFKFPHLFGNSSPPQPRANPSPSFTLSKKTITFESHIATNLLTGKFWRHSHGRWLVINNTTRRKCVSSRAIDWLPITTAIFFLLLLSFGIHIPGYHYSNYPKVGSCIDLGCIVTTVALNCWVLV